MKKNIFSLLALIFGAWALLVSLLSAGFVWHTRQEYETRLAALEAQLAGTAAEIQMPAGLESWSLSAVAWSENDGADVTLRAVPETYAEGITASLIVSLEGAEAASASCDWDGTAFQATVSLPAENGYSYCLILTGAGGAEQEILLTSPENPADLLCVHLADSLSAYCSLMVNDYAAQASNLTITAAFGQVQLPRISADGSEAALKEARLVLKLNGDELGSQSVSMSPGEAAESYELYLTDAVFEIPGLENGDELTLWLEITLSDGRSLSACGTAWYLDGGQLLQLAG